MDIAIKTYRARQTLIEMLEEEKAHFDYFEPPKLIVQLC